MAEVARQRSRRRGAGDSYAETWTPIGPCFAAWNPTGVSAVRESAGDAAGFERWFAIALGRPLVRAPAVPVKLAGALARGAWAPGLRLDLRGLTEFQKAVLLGTLEIPRGQVRTYSWLARQIGHPGAARAVGNALARNPIPVLIPCHRVVRGDGAIGDYGAGGGTAKRVILAHEGVAIPLGGSWNGND